MRAARLLPLLALLAGCVDFVDPAGLRLARDTRIEVGFELTNRSSRVSCPVGAAVPADSAVLCVTATVDPGYTRLGERFRVLDDTLRAMGVALSPVLGPDSVLRYEGRFTLPIERLEEIPFTATLPRLEGGQPPSREIRWFAVGPADPDTLVRAPGEAVRFRIDRPVGTPVPPPSGTSSWSLDVTGDTATATYRGSGIPGTTYRFPAEVLAALGGGRFGAELRWFRSTVIPASDLQVIVRFTEWLGWTVLTEEEPEPTVGADGL